jgi:hypothetical protein
LHRRCQPLLTEFSEKAKAGIPKSPNNELLERYVHCEERFLNNANACFWEKRVKLSSRHTSSKMQTGSFLSTKTINGKSSTGLNKSKFRATVRV